MVMEASCPAANVKFTPVSPPRLNLYSFKDLPVGVVESAKAAPAPKTVLDAARFTPYALRVTRNLDLSGSGASRENMAELIGEVIVPNTLAPQTWGKPDLQEARDASGHSLVNSAAENQSSMREDYEEEVYENLPSGNRQEKKAPPSNDHREKVRLRFQAPDWKVKEIASIKASIDLVYFSGSRLVAISNAVPDNWITSGRNYSFSGGSDHAIRSAELTDAGIKLSMNMAMEQSGCTTLMFQVMDGKSGITDIQLYDASGKPVKPPTAAESR